MFDVFMMTGVAYLAMGFGILQFAFLRWLFKQDSFLVFAVAFCTLLGCDFFLIGCMFL